MVEKGLASQRSSEGRECSMDCDAAKPRPVVMPRVRVSERRVEAGRMLMGRMGRRTDIMNGDAIMTWALRGVAGTLLPLLWIVGLMSR